MSGACRFPHPLERDGASQRQRPLAALDPASAPVDERRVEDLLLYVRRYADLLRYVTPDNSFGGTWADLIDNDSSLLVAVTDHAAHPPHMALLLAFLQLLGHARDHLNTLTGEHLEFYYRDVLGLAPKAAEPDRVHLLFELAKGVASHRLAADTELKAGKDAAGGELVYATDGELVANRAALDADHGLKTIFLADDDGVVMIHAAPDADSADGRGAKIEDEEGKWPGFGSAGMPRAEIGFALASPMFFLAEGARLIDITLKLDSEVPAVVEGALKDHVTVWASGAKGWIELTITEVSVADGTITWNLELGPDEGPIVAYDANVLADGFQTCYPVVKLILDPDVPPYSELRGRKIAKLTITVSVEGMKSLILENDFGVLDPAKPFLPFGPVPRVGSRFLIGSPEVFQKRLTNLDLDIEWADLPATGFAAHYSGYSSPPADNSDFTAKFSLLNSDWSATESLFDAGTGAPAATRTHAFTLADPPSRPAELVDFQRFGPSLRQGFLVAKLGQGFYHGQYPQLLAKAAIDGQSAQVPNPPYTPLIASLTLGYTAEETVDAAGGTCERLFRIGPFGHREVDPFGARLLPFFPDEGTLLIGLAEVEPPQNLALLFQVAEGSEDPATAVPEIAWSYLADEDWVPFKTPEILADTTNGLLTSGVIRFALPEAMSASRTVLPAGRRWLRATVAAGTAAIPHLIAVHPQAVVASFRDRGNDPSHLATALPGGTIAKLRQRQAAVKSVSQPFASFGGRMEESVAAFALRVSERLRHKGRAITPFDYERLVLETFPEVYKVRCINHTRTVQVALEDDEHAPGHVKLVAVPNLRNKNAVDPLQPRLSLDKLESIRAFLSELATPFVQLEVTNPDYEEIRVRFNVRFHPGFDKGFYTKKLQDDIVGFLSPWLEDDAADLSLGGRIHRSSILHFVEKREYVDFVTDFEMDQIVGSTTIPNVEEAVATRASAALVSAPSHTIEHGTTSCED